MERSSQLHQDLENKLDDDIRLACKHFVDMCKVVDIGRRDCLASICTVLLNRGIEVALFSGVSPAQLTEMLDKTIHHVHGVP